MSLRFEKYEGLGNDFVLVDADSAPPLAAEEIRALCDRHRGIGADGLIRVTQARSDALAAMEVWNADGSLALNCGNGLRCVVLYLLRCGHEPAALRSARGTHRCRFQQLDANHASVEVAMETPRFEPDALPLRSAAPWVGETRTLAGLSLRVTAVSMGNPHAVIFDPVAPALRDSVASALASKELFPEGVNVGFAELCEPGHIDLAVWERGAGPTLACGTGACAAAIAASRLGLVPADDSPLQVQQPGGSVQVRMLGEERTPHLEGPARFVFGGEFAA